MAPSFTLEKSTMTYSMPKSDLFIFIESSHPNQQSCFRKLILCSHFFFCLNCLCMRLIIIICVHNLRLFDIRDYWHPSFYQVQLWSPDNVFSLLNDNTIYLRRENCMKLVKKENLEVDSWIWSRIAAWESRNTNHQANPFPTHYYYFSDGTIMNPTEILLRT